MKTITIISVALATLLFSCKKDEAATSNNNITSTINAFPKESLSNEEISSLIWMREEEKLAYDVYITLYGQWNVKIFTNIASSEQTHTNSVLTLLNKYGISDPVKTNPVGVYSDTTIQKLYTQLTTQGKSSLLNAFIVGATIEDLDISDLNELITKVDNQDIKYVYENLNKGSRNHMRSFYSQITGAGGNYAAQFITQAEFEAIINSPKETGSW
ncbi:MAG: DUF2202 domain-containing protein [Sphingobacteriales bacterium]|nr:DUF2202 domain-containing protein [Sphingobacteriales bacterium]